LIRLKNLERKGAPGLDWWSQGAPFSGDFAISPQPNIAITYCRLCNWLLRAAWMGQELLSTFAEELGSVTLIPDDTGGVFEVRLDGKLLWSRAEHGRFPEIKELKQLVRDQVAPERDLGHVDHKGPKA
jgi:selenoprotein W-related protein